MIRMKYSHRPCVCEKSSTEYAVDHIISSQKESLSGGAMAAETENCKKLCADCKTSTTPLWRCGPTGPKSLCNACGIRFRKKLGMNKGSSDKKKENPSASPASSSTSTTAQTTINGTYEKGNDGKISVHDYKKVIDEKTSVSKGKEATLGGDLRMRLMGLGKEVVLQRRPRSPMKRQRSAKKLGEVEQAALLLMALSYGSVYYACF